MSEETNTWEQRAIEIAAELGWTNELSGEYLDITSAYLQGIKEFKEALKKEVEKEILINDNILKSKDKRIFGYLKYCNYGLKKTIELSDKVRPIEHE